MFCGHCGKEIADSASFCPYCGNKMQEEHKENRSPKKERKKHKGRKMFAFIIIALIAVGGIGVFFLVKKQEILSLDKIMELVSQQQDEEFEENEVENEKDNEIMEESEEESMSFDKKETEENTAESISSEEESGSGEKERMKGAEEADSAESIEIREKIIQPEVMIFTEEMVEQLGVKELGFVPDAVVESSHVIQTEFSYDYAGWSAFDHDLTSSWQEGADGAGIGEYVGIDFGEVHQIKMITLALGNHRSERLWKENNIPKRILVEIGEQEIELEFPEEKEIFAVVFPEEIEASDIRVTIKDVYMGTKYPETAIAEIGVWEKSN